MDRYRVWTLTADLPAADLRHRASKVLGFIPPVTAGAWASVNGLGGNRPPEWMQQLSNQLEQDDIEHQIY